ETSCTRVSNDGPVSTVPPPPAPPATCSTPFPYTTLFRSTFTATSTDAAGNASTTSGSLVVTIDTTAPSAPSAPDLTAGTDSGTTSAEHTTALQSRTLTVSRQPRAKKDLKDGTVSVGQATA